MMRTVVAGVGLVAASLLLPAVGMAQHTGAVVEAPLAVVKELFDGMRAGDSARVRAVFHPRMVAMTTTEVLPGGEGKVTVTPVEAFVRRIGTPRRDVIDERTFNPRTLVEGTLASVWVDYTLYIGTRLSHCGVDVFQVAKDGGTWKIVALSDTRRLTGCTP